MLKLAQVMAGASQGGAENHYVRLILALHEDTDIVQLPILRTHAEREATLAHAGLSPITMRFGGPIDFGTQIRLRRTLQDFGPDVVLTWMTRAAHKCPAGPWKLAARLGGYYNLKYYRRIEYFIGISEGKRNIHREQWSLRGNSYLVPHFRYRIPSGAEHAIWGATARMISMLVAALGATADM